MRKWGWEEVGTGSCGKNGERETGATMLVECNFQQTRWLSTFLPWIQARVSQPTDSFPTHNSPFVCMCTYVCIWAKVCMGVHEEAQSWCGEWSFISLLSYEMRENHFLTSKAHGSEGNKIINSALICVGAYMYREAQGQCQESFSIPLPPYSVRHWISQIQSMQITTLHASLL